MTHLLPRLPYDMDALAPLMSKETLEYHYGKHLQAYIDNLNRLIAGTPYEQMTLEEIVVKSDKAVFNNAAQTWNHTFFFQTLTPRPVSLPEKLEQILIRDFGSAAQFREQFAQAALGLFGSGWAWLAMDPDGKTAIRALSNAGNPMTEGLKPLLTVDVWEHAYYIDHRNRRTDFIQACLQLTDWNKVAERL